MLIRLVMGIDVALRCRLRFCLSIAAQWWLINVNVNADKNKIATRKSLNIQGQISHIEESIERMVIYIHYAFAFFYAPTLLYSSPSGCLARYICIGATYSVCVALVNIIPMTA